MDRRALLSLNVLTFLGGMSIGAILTILMRIASPDSILGVGDFIGIGLVLTSIVLTFVTWFYALQTKEQAKASKEAVDEMRHAREESAKARSASVLLEIYELMSELRPDWHRFYLLPSYDNWDSWKDDYKVLADRVGVALEKVSHLCMADLVDRRLVMEGWAESIDECWKRLEPYIVDYRRVSGIRRQRIHFEQFARECREYREGQQSAVSMSLLAQSK